MSATNKWYFLMGAVILSQSSYAQPAESCRSQDLVTLGKRIATFRMAAEEKGFSAEQVDSVVQGYQDTLLGERAAACSQISAIPEYKPATPTAREGEESSHQVGEKVSLPVASPRNSNTDTDVIGPSRLVSQAGPAQSQEKLTSAVFMQNDSSLHSQLATLVSPKVVAPVTPSESPDSRPAALSGSFAAETEGKKPSPAVKTSGALDNGFYQSYIGGVEQSGYSSEITNTNAFLSAYLRSGYTSSDTAKPGVALWGRVRLLSAPQPSTQNIVSVITDPSGQITQNSLSKVGEVVDYSLGLELRRWEFTYPTSKESTRISFFAALGETTPLTANTQLLTYTAPGQNTSECAQLTARYAPPLLFPDADPAQKSCIWNPLGKTPYKYIAFTAQDRSNFLFKYGGGIRLTHVYPNLDGGTRKYSGIIDLGLGQDESVTGGNLHGTVFKLDGQVPSPFPGTSLLYFFGSASMRLGGNRIFAPLTLAVPTAGVPTIPDPSVAVLPLQQPTRDFYRFGAGLNMLNLFKKK